MGYALFREPASVPQPTQATAAAAMPPKIEGPTQHQLTTDEEWATVHGDDAEKGWLRAGW